MNLGIKTKFRAIKGFLNRHKKAAILTTLAATVGVSGLVYGLKLNAALTMKTDGDAFCTIHRISSSNKLTGCYASTYKYIVDTSGSETLELTAYCADINKSAPPSGTSMSLYNGVITDEQFNVLALGYSKVYKDIDGDGVNNGRYFEGGTIKTRKQNYMITQLALWAVTEGWKEGYLGQTPISQAVLPKCDDALSGLTSADLETTKNGYLDLCKKARQKPYSQTPLLETDYHKRGAYKQSDGTMKTGLFTITTNNFYSGSYTIKLNGAPSGTKVMNGETDEDITGKSVTDLKSFYFVLPSQGSSGSFTYDLTTSGGKYMKAGYYAGNDDSKQPVARIKIRTAETHPTENGTVTYTSSPGVIRVWKVSSENGNTKLGNANFTLKKADGTDVLTQSTDGNGQSDFGGLDPGNYKLVENTAPSGYEIMVKSTDVVVEAGKITEVTVKNKPIKNKIKIIKKDNSGSLLSGATFQIINSSGTVVATLTTGSDGTATSGELAYGTYTVKETSAPSGYEMASPSSQTVTISNSTSTYSVNFVNNKKPGKLTIVKSDENGGRIQGVVFEIYKGSAKVGTVTTDSYGQASIDLEEGSYTYKEVSAPSKYKVDSTSKSFTITKGETTVKSEVNYPVKSVIKVTKTDADSGSFLSGAQFTLYKENKSTVVATGTSNDIGVITFNNVPYGKYYLKETTPPSGYRGYTGYMEMNVTADGATLTATFPNTKEVGNIKLTKTSTKGGNLANAKFKLFKSDKTTLVTTGVTNSSGVVEFNNLPLGTYYVQEYEAPSGYVLNSQFIEAKLVTHLATVNLSATNKPAEGSIELTKTDVTTGAALQGAEFKLYKSDKTTAVGTATTNSNGKITLSSLPIGTYYYQETKAPSGYVLDSTLHPIEITSDGQVVRATVTNTKSAGKLKIIKKDINTNAVIPNAKFRIYASNGTTVVTTGVTNASGIAEFTLDVGTYYYQEYESPSGYKLNSNKFQFTISENGQIQQATMTNTPADGTFEITKTDVTNSTPLQGASFRILKEDQSTVVTTGTTDSSGKLSKVLPLGKYYYQETSAPSGYVLDSTLKPFEITADGQVVKANVTNVKIKGGLEITKTGSNSKALQGAEFSLYKEDKSTLIASGTTNSYGKLTFNDLPYGTYYYKETKAPSGYVLDSSWKTLNIQTNGSVQSVTITNKLKYGSFELTKTDAKGTALPGTEITLTNKTTGATTVKTTDSNGKVSFTNLTEGEYSYQETKAPEGYAIDSKVYTFSITSDGQKVSKTITNNKITNKIKIVKSDSKTGSLLAGAKIGIYKTGTDTEVATATTDSNGVATFDSLEYGSYYYKEITPPSGYKLNSTKCPFTVTKDGVTQDFEIKNDKDVSLKIKKTLSNPNYALDSESYMITVKGKFADGSTSKAISFTKAEATSGTTKDVPNVIYGETYTITEANQDKYTYTISDNSVTLSDSKTVTITNTVKPSGKLTVTKKLGAGTVMGDDETFTITVKGKFAGSTKTQISRTIKKSEIGTAIEVPNVIYGETYEITEGNNDSYAVTIDKSSVTMNGTNQNVTITNSAKKAGALYVKKTADAKTVNNNDEFNIVVKGSFSDTQATSKTITFKKSELNTQKEVSGVKIGETYQISEENNTNYNATVSEKSVTVTNVSKTVEITNTRKPSGKLKITKSLTDPTGNNSDTYTMTIKGEFSDTTETTKTISFTQDEVNKKTVKEISGVLYGNTYTITEQTSGNRYTVSYTKSITSDNAEDVTNNNEVKMTDKDVTVTVTNKVNTGSIEITKKDVSTADLIPNAKVRIKDATGKVVFQGTTDQNGVVKFSMLPVGSYTYEEYESPSGYVLNDTPFPFEIKSDGQIVKSTLSNTKIEGKAEITKTDITTSKPLPNATITIKKESGAIVAEKTTGADGKVTFDKLPAGKYIYCETVAPSGYVLNKVEGKFEISTNGQIFKATIEDEKIKGNLELTKVNIENSNPLAGAKFEILASDKTTVVATGTTDNSGKITISNLEYGSYYYRETEAPKGFVLDDSLKPFEIKNNGETVKVTVNNSPSEGGFELTKTDVATGKVIPNAKFKIYAEDKKTVVTQGVTDEKGVAKFTLKVGKYWYQEYEAPSGYLLDNELYSFEIKENKQIVKATMTNEKPKGDFKLTKTDEKGVKLEGATFEILSEDGSKVLATKTTDKNGEILVTDLTAGTYQYRETKAPSGYVLDTGLKTFTITKDGEVVSVDVVNSKSVGKLIITKKDISSGKLLPNTKFKIYASDKTTVVTEGITDSNGVATFTLPVGTYYYQETEAPEGYIVNDEKHQFTLTENGQEEKVEMTNELIKGSIEILKQDGEDQTPLKGAKFEILDSKKTKVAEGTTDANGKLTIDKLTYGKYYYKEVTAPSGYELDSTEHEFLINTNNQVVKIQVNDEKSKGSLEITKVNNETNIKLSGAVFTIYASDKKTVVGTITTDTEGKGTIKLPLGTYYYKETKSPSGFHGDEDFQEFKLETHNQVVKKTVNNDRDTGDFELTKKDVSSGKLIPNAKFKIYASDKTTVVTEGTTDDNGLAKFKLPLGKYYYQEYEAPSGYVLDDTLYEFTLVERDKVVKAEMTNTREAGKFEISKTDVTTSKPLENAKFRIYASDKTTIVKEGVTDSEGKVTFTLPTGTYYYQEYEAPTNYLYDTGLVKFEIKANNEVVKANITNEKAKANIKIIKVDGDHDKPLQGAKFQIFKSDKKTVVTKATTDAKGEITVNDLEVGTYYVQEYEAPTGYVLDQTLYPLNLNENGKTFELKVLNNKSAGELEITKNDLDSGELLDGATYQILAEDGTTVVKTGTTAKGKVTFTLPYGNYFYQETKAPSGYVLDETKHAFSITENGQKITETRTNEKMKGNILITKTDEDQKPIANVKFKIYKEDKTTVVKEVTTDKEGKVTIESLPIGKYYYQETETPSGYIKDDEIKELTIQSNKQLLEINVVNKKARGSLEILKVGKDGTTPLQGAEFALYDKEGKNVLKTGTTNAEGKLVFENLELGEYKYKETKAPSGYKLDDTMRTFTLSKNEQIEKVTVTNGADNVKFKIIKLSKDTKKPLAGVKFAIYDKTKTNKIDEGTTNEKGEVEFTLPLGEYTYLEIEGLDGYVMDNTYHEFTLAEVGKNVEVTVENETGTGKLQITKKDIADGELLPNAKFKIYKEDKTTVVTEGTTNDKGLAEFTLPVGVYYYQEYDAPSGYILDDSLHQFEIKKDGEIVKAEMTNTKKAGQLEISKTDIASSKPIENAKFKIYADDKKTVLKEGITDAQGKATFVLPTGNYFFQEYEAPENYLYDTGLIPFEIKENNQVVKASVTNEMAKANIKIIKVDGETQKPLKGAKFILYGEDKTTQIGEYTTDDKGEITVNDLTVGKYYFKESQAPEGYVTDQTLYEVELTENGKTYEKTVTNNNSAGEIEITKTDLADGTVLPGAKYRITDLDGNMIKEGVTGDDGKVTFTLKYGKYYYQEIEAPSGYLIDNEKHQFSIEENGQKLKETRTNEKMKANIIITKTDEESKPISGVKFKILGEDKKTVIKEVTTDDKGKATINDLVLGKYYYQEVETGSKYILDNEIKPLELTNHGQNLEINVVNKKAKGSLEILKVSKDGTTPLKGAEFTLYDKDGKTVIKTGTTNEEGKLVFEDLELGEYKYQETKAPSGYKLDDTMRTFTLSKNEQVEKVTVVNGADNVKFKIIKISKDTKDKLAGVRFGIFDADGKTKVDEGVTDANGEIEFTLPLGDYTYYEIEGLDSYVKDNEYHKFSLTEIGKNVEVTVENETGTGELEITKKDISNGDLLPNAKFKIYKEDKTTVVTEGTTDDKGIAKFKLPVGTYYYQEYDAPSGYIVEDTLHEFQITKDGQIVKFTETNTRKAGKLEISKTDIATSKPLEGAKFKIYAEDKTTVLKEGVTDAEGKATFTLPTGNYYFQEYEAPTNYLYNTGLVPFEIKENDQIVKASVTNEKAKANLKIVKVDGETQKPLKGAKFTVYKEDKTTEVQQATTDENGEITINDLEVGKYYFKETEAPTGYVVDQTLYELNLAENGKTYEKKVTNNQSAGELEITKKDLDSGEILPGAKFRITDLNGTTVKEGVTGEDGKVTFTLKYGEYYYYETEAPSGYLVDGTKHKFSITENGQKITEERTNEKMKANILIVKKDEDDKPISGVKFKILGEDKTTEIKTITTNDEGKATIENLVLGKYYYQEIETGSKYILDDEIKPLELTNHGQTLEINVVNKKAKGSLEILKVGRDGTTPLKGAEFTLYDKDEKELKTATSDENGKVTFDDLELGEYKYKETKAPSGYVLDDTMRTFTLTKNGQIEKTTVTNGADNVKFKIIKIAKDGKDKLAGVRFGIYDAEGKNKIDEGVTDANGEVTFTLPLGDYSYYEIEGLDGFVKDKDYHKFTLDEVGVNKTVTVENETGTGELQITKKDISDGKLLPNAKFKIYKEDKATVVVEGTTDENGLAKFTLPVGKYYYQEYEAPSGYILEDSLHEFQIKKDGEIVKFDATNTRKAGKLEISKTDIATSKPLEGAKFKIYDEDKTTVVKEGITDSEGKVTFVLPSGKYYFQEYEAPKDYLYNTGLVPFEIKENNEIVKASVTNEKMKANIKIIKTDVETGKVLKGAKYKIYASDKTTVVKEGETDANGEFLAENLEVGTYYYQETEAPEGYVLDKTLYEVKLTENEKTYEQKATNTMSAGEIEITKTDLDDGKILPGAKYRITNANGDTIKEGVTGEDGKVTFTLKYGNYFYQEIESPSGYLVDSKQYPFSITKDGQKIKETRTNEKMKGNILIKKTNEDGEVLAGVKFKILQSDKKTEVKTITTDSKGEAKIENLPIGKYYYQEVETSNKYVLDNEIKELNLTNHGQTLEISVVNKKAKGSLKVIKKSKDGDKPLADAEFTVYDDKDKVVATAKTNDQGEVTFNDLLVGEYYVKETKAPTGYVLNTEKVSFGITKEGEEVTKTVLNDKIKGDFELTKKDISNGDLVPNTSFRIYKEDKTTVVTEGKTDKDGVAKFKDLEYGKYYYQEFDAPDDFVIDNGLYEFEIKENGVTVKAEMKDKLKDGKIILTKKDDEGAFLADVQFKIYSSDKKTVVKEGKTDSNGKLEFTLQPGTYYYQEVETPSGYIIDNKLHEFTIERAAKTTEVEVVNKFIRASVTVNKTGVEIKSPLEGAKFKITQDGKDVTIQTGNGEGESVFTTDKDGKINIPQKLKVGKYQLVELSAPSGYKVAEPIDFEVTKDDNAKDIKLEVKDQEIKGNIKLVKTDDNDNTLAGVKFKLVQTKDTRGNEVNKEIGTYTTDSNGEIEVKDLLYGEYYIQEVETVEGYVLDDNKIDFTITEDGKTIDLNKVNKHAKGNVVLTKVDSKDRKPLEGVKFELFNSNDESQGEYTTDSNGEIKVEDLVYGKYYFKEKETIEGYVKSEDKVDFNIQEDGATVKVEAENDRITGDMELTKTDVVDGDLVPNANFEILAEDKETVVVKGKTDENGKATFKLDYGKYYYREFGAPEGYVLDDTPYPFEIKSKDEIVKCEMTNKPITGELEITKKDIIDGELIPNAKFEILNEDKEVVKKGTTDENGIAKFKLDYGKYYYHEYDAPSGYILDDKLYPFEIKTDGEIIKCIATNRKEVTPETPQNRLPKTGVISAVGGVSALALGGLALGLRRKSRK